jgi:hypothetical protein
MKRHSASNDDFIAPAKRAFRRVAVRVRAENAKLKLPLIVGEKGRVKRVSAKLVRTSS